MNIFNKRPLCLILCIGLCGFFLFSLDIPIIRIGLCCISLLLLIICLFLRKRRSKQILIALVSFALILASLLSYLYFDCYFNAYDIYEDEVKIEGVVIGVSESSSYTTRLHVNIERLNDKYGKSYSVYAYVKKAEAKGVVEGTRVSFYALLEGFSDESRSYNISKGINAYASDVRDFKIIEYTSGDLTTLVSKAREYVTRYIISRSDKDSGAIVSALLLGERDYLPSQLRLDFRRIGISHILALSGMHLAILSLGIEKLLMLLRIGKKKRIITTVIFVCLYMAFTGFSVSVVRAGLMLIIGSLLFLLSRGKDSLTSLAVAVTIICIINPNAIYDVSLHLSALATFGIIALGENTRKFKQAEDILGKILRYISFGILASVFAISATLAVSTYNFGGFSILAPVATIIFSILAEVIMYLGCLLLLVGWILPVGWLLTPVCFLMTRLALLLSSLEFAYVSSNFDFVKVMIIVYTVIFFLYLILKFKKPIKVMNVIVVLYMIVTVVPAVATVYVSNDETLGYYSSAKCDEVLVRSENQVCLINSAQYAKNLAYTTIDFLEDANVTYLDKYYLTHYSWSIDDELEVLLSNVLVEEIYLPAPRNDDEETILKVIYKTVEDYRAEVVLFQEYETVSVGKYSINLLYSSPYGETSMNAFTVAKGDEVYTYISSGLLASDKAEYLKNCISLSDHLILGEHGKKYSSKTYIEEFFNDLDSIIIQGENIYLKQENMEMYLNNGCEIYSHPEEIVYYK